MINSDQHSAITAQFRMKCVPLLLCVLAWASVESRPQYEEDIYGEEYYYQEYGEEDSLGYYNYEDNYVDQGAGREPEPYPYPQYPETTTTTTTTTTRRPTTTTTRRPYYYTTTTRYQTLLGVM